MEQYIGDLGIFFISLLMLLYVTWDIFFPK